MAFLISYKAKITAILISLSVAITSCGEDPSYKFKVAGCASIQEWSYTDAATQFDLAAVNGDPEAVSAASKSRTVWALMMDPRSDITSYEELQKEIEADGAYADRLIAEIKAYCAQ